MLKFGYLTEDNDKVGGALSPNSAEFQASIRRLQRFGNIPITGKIDAATIKLINTDRCGLKDSSNSVIGRFNLQGTIWKKRVSLYPNNRLLTQITSHSVCSIRDPRI